MDYLPDIADQTRLFLHSLGFGFSLGVLYDLFRVVRLAVAPRGRRGYLLAQDIVYSVICTVLSFFFFLAVGDGALRGFAFIGEILGWLVYYFSLGAVAMRVSEWLVVRLRRFSRAALRLLTSPFLRFLKFLEKISRGIRKIRINLKFVKKNLYYRLQSTPGMVYNVGRSSLAHQKEKHRLAKDPETAAHHIAEQRRASGQKAVRQAQPRRKLPGAARGAGVRAFRGVPYSPKPRKNRGGQGGNRGPSAADRPPGGTE